MSVSSVLFINDFCSTRGGADEVAIIEATTLAARGMPVHFAHMDANGNDRCDSRLHSPNITLHDFSALGGVHRHRQFLLDGIHNAAALAAVTSLAEQLGADRAIHVHGWTKGFSPSVLTLGVRLGRKVVYTFHDYIYACPNGSFYDFADNGICHRQPLGLACSLCNCDRQSRLYKGWRLARQLAIRRNLRRAQDYQVRVTVSNFARRIFERNAVAIDQVLSNPIDVPQTEFRDSSARKAIYFIGRLVPEKGPDVLAEAARAAKTTCDFIGTGSLEASLKAEYPEHRFHGWLDRASIGRQLEEARAVVFPSRWYETQGLTPLEAAAQGVPALCAETCAASETTVNGETGITFPQVDVASLAEAIRKTQDDRLIARLSRNVYDRFWAGGFDRETHADRLLELYRSG
jgi:glycosyltransferase involved in cell wall biosynthesis